jgi:hypothetical protein
MNSTLSHDPSDMEKEVYKTLAGLYNSEESSFWTRNNILMAVQGFLIAATANIVSNVDKAIGSGANPKSGVLFSCALIGLAIVGLGSSIGWMFMVGRAVRVEKIIRHQLTTVESKLVLAAPFQVFTRFGVLLEPSCRDPALEPRRWNGSTRLSDVWAKIGGGLAVIWLILLILFVTAFLKGYIAPAAPVVAAVDKDARYIEVLAVTQKAADAAERASSSAEQAVAMARQALEASQASQRPQPKKCGPSKDCPPAKGHH